MGKLFGSDTSKRWWITLRLAILIVITGWTSMGVVLYYMMLSEFVTLSITTMTVLAGLNGVYNFSEAYRPHVPPGEVTVQQSNVQVNPTIEISKPVDDDGEELPPNPWVGAG